MFHKNKKAVAGFTLQMVIAITMALAVALVIAGIVFLNSNVPIDSKKSTADMFVARLMMGQDGITKHDPVTGVIDPARVTKKRLLAWDNKEVPMGNRLAALISIDNEAVFVNKGVYERINPLLQFELNEKLESGYSVNTPEGLYLYSYPVVYEAEGYTEYDMLEIRVVVTDE